MTEEEVRKLAEDLGENPDELTEDDIEFIQRCAAAKKLLDGLAELQKMLEADCAARKGITREWEKGMAAALDVAVGQLLGDKITDDEHDAAVKQGAYAIYGKTLLASRRSRYQKPQLLPCPFCGGEASPNGVLRRSSSPDCRWSDGSECLEAFYCNCVRCGTKNGGIAGGYQTKAQAIEHWNKRNAGLA